MPIINITVLNKNAMNLAEAEYVCNNSDYLIAFDFDSEWDVYPTKTARFVKETGEWIDQVFTGRECPMPTITDAYRIFVGVYAGNLRTTTPAYITAKKSILCGGGAPEAPSEDVYNQIMDRLNAAGEGVVIAPATDTRLGCVKVGSGLKIKEDGTLYVDVIDDVIGDSTQPITSAAVYAEVGNINALLESI